MVLLTSRDVTNWYLYGQEDTPDNLVDERLIRPEDTTETISVDAAAFMKDGGGRFAIGSQFEIIQKFFDENDVPSLPEGKEFYNKNEIAAFYNLGSFGLSFSQINRRDSKNDYAERTYIFNSTAFEISDNTRFYVDSKGEKWIENFSIKPRDDIEDNFDFDGGGFITDFGNFILEPNIDPSKIGRKVIFDYDNGTSAVYEIYDEFSYGQEQNIAATWQSRDVPKLFGDISTLVESLENDGIISFVDEQDRPIFYGTLGNNQIKRSFFAASLYPQLFPKIDNGIVVLAGAGKDIVFGTDKPDDIYAGTDADIDILKGKAGDDTYSVHPNDIVIDNTVESISFSPATVLQDLTPEEFKLNQLLIDGETQTAGDSSNYTITPDISTQLAPLNLFSEKSRGEKLEFKWFVDGVENYFPIMHDPAKDITYYRFLEGTVIEYGNGTDNPDRIYLAREDGAAPVNGDFGITYEYYAMLDSFNITKLPINDFYINDDSTWLEIANLVSSPEWIADYTEPIYQELLAALESADVDEEDLENDINPTVPELTPEEIAEIEAKEAAPSAQPTEGNDILLGTNEADFVVGSVGNDIGQGLLGNDEYFWGNTPENAGGSFTLTDTGGELDIVNIFNQDPASTAITRSGNNIDITLSGGSIVTLVDQFTNPQFEWIRFDDGTIYTPENLIDMADIV